MRIKKSQLRRLIRESMTIPGWVESHFAWRNVAFTHEGEVRYINDVASPETVSASEDLGEPVPPGTNVLVVFGAYPDTKSEWMHDSELLELIKREGWHERPAPEGANPEGFWDGKGEWQGPDEHGLPDFDLPDLPPATEGKMRIKKSHLRKMIREALDTHKYRVGDIVRYRNLSGIETTLKVNYRVTPYEEQADLKKKIEYDPDGIKNGKPGFEGTIISGKEKGREAWGYDTDILYVEPA